MGVTVTFSKCLDQTFGNRSAYDSLNTIAILDGIIENMPDSIYITDGDANAIRINPAFEKISGLDRNNMLGRSPRRDHLFTAINCGALPELLAKSELFGYEGGAFTGAKREGRIGLIEAASKGTLFLDEVGELTLSIQVKLLRILLEKQLVRVAALNLSLSIFV